MKWVQSPWMLKKKYLFFFLQKQKYIELNWAFLYIQLKLMHKKISKSLVKNKNFVYKNYYILYFTTYINHFVSLTHFQF